MNVDTVWAVARFCDTQTALRLTSLNRHLLCALSKERELLKRRQRFEEARGRIAEHVGELQHRTCYSIGTNVIRADYTIITKALTVVVHRYIYENRSSELVAMLASVALFERFLGTENMYSIRCNRGVLCEKGDAYPYDEPYLYSCTSAFLSDYMVARGESELGQMHPDGRLLGSQSV